MNQPSPQPTSDHYRGESGRAYFENYQDRLARVGTSLNIPLYQPFVRSSDVVLDFACGGGELLIQLRAGRKLGVEVNQVALASARARGLDVHEALDSVPADSIDVIISNHGLEHTLDPYGILCELRRVARPGGALVLYLPTDSWWRQRTFKRGDVNHHLYTWTPLLLGNLLSDAGWTVDYVRLVFHSWPPRGYALVAALPTRVAQAICHACGIALLQPQVHALAHKNASE